MKTLLYNENSGRQLITTVFHPKTNELSYPIHKEDTLFYYDENSDWYETLSECKREAKKDLDYYYKGLHIGESFRPEINTDLFLTY